MVWRRVRKFPIFLIMCSGYCRPTPLATESSTTKDTERHQQDRVFWPRFLIFMHALSEIHNRMPTEFEWHEGFFNHLLKTFSTTPLVRSSTLYFFLTRDSAPSYNPLPLHVAYSISKLFGICRNFFLCNYFQQGGICLAVLQAQ